MINFALTLLSGSVTGYLFYRLKVPGGVLVGSIIGAALLSICFNASYVPLQARVLAQTVAGAYIGSLVDKSDLLRLRYIWRPALLLLSAYLCTNLILGAIIYNITPLDLTTSFLCAAPGGMSDIPLIAGDMGASPAKVAVLQFVRMIVCTSLFPTMINRVCEKKCQTRSNPLRTEADNACWPDDEVPEVQTVPKAEKTKTVFLLTAAIAGVSGILGYAIRMPAGSLFLSMIGVAALNLGSGKAYMPMWSKRTAQMLSGVYIGSLVGPSELFELQNLVLPALIVLLGYTAFCFGISFLLERLCHMTRKEAMLAATPAGGSDMALISLDMGVKSTDLVLLHIIRLIVVIAVFPQVMHFISILVV